MYSCKVGTDFKVSFLKRSLNFCYDQNEGIIYASDLDTLEKLGIEKSLITEAYVDKVEDKKETPEIEEQVSLKKVEEVFDDFTKQINEQNSIQYQNFQRQYELLEKRFNSLKEKEDLLEQSIKQIVDFQKELLEQQEQDLNEHEDSLKTLKNSVGLLNKKIKETNEKLENVSVRYEAVVELLTEQAATEKKSENPVNMLKNGITLERIWNSTKNKNDAAVMSIMLMMKRVLEEKGMRL